MFVFAGGNAIASIIGMASGLLTARLVEPADLGLFNGFKLILAYLPFVQMGIINGLSRELPYHAARNDGHDMDALGSECVRHRGPDTGRSSRSTRELEARPRLADNGGVCFLFIHEQVSGSNLSGYKQFRKASKGESDNGILALSAAHFGLEVPFLGPVPSRCSRRADCFLDVVEPSSVQSAIAV